MNKANLDRRTNEHDGTATRSDWSDSVAAVIAEAEAGAPVFTHQALSGYSGAKLIGLLQRLARLIEHDPALAYAEIGVFQGLTLLSVGGAAPGLTCVGIDNFSQFDPAFTNKALVQERRELLGLDNVQLVDCDFEEAFERNEHFNGKKIGLLFVDGPHDYRSQMLSVLLALRQLAEQSIIVVDDCNYEHVRLATRDLLRLRPDLHLVFEAYTPRHPVFATPEENAVARNGWWNGTHVLVRDTRVTARSAAPSFGNARMRAITEHVLQSHGIADHLLEVSDLVYDLALKPTLPELRRGLKLLRVIRDDLKKSRRFKIGNTYSESLPPTCHHNDPRE